MILFDVNEKYFHKTHHTYQDIIVIEMYACYREELLMVRFEINNNKKLDKMRKYCTYYTLPIKYSFECAYNYSI